MRKVLYVPAGDTTGAVDDGLFELVSSLDRARHRAHVVLTERGPQATAFARLGIDVHVVPEPPLRRTGRWLLWLWRLVHVFAVMRSQRPAVVHLDAGAGRSAAFAAWLHCRLGGARLVWHLRSAPAPTGRLDRLLARLLHNRADAVIARSSPIAQQLGRRDRICVIPSSFDVQRFAAAARSPRPEGAPTLGWTGNIAPGCGLDHALAVFAMLRASRPGVRLVIAAQSAPGHAEHELALRTRCQALADAIEWLPAALPAAQGFARMDVLLHLPDAAEGGAAVAMALAAGVPVVTWSRGDGADAVQDGATGCVVAAGDVMAAADAAGELLADPSRRRRMGAAAAEFAQATFDRVRCARAFESAYAANPG